jgi:hypothetical protein
LHESSPAAVGGWVEREHNRDERNISLTPRVFSHPDFWAVLSCNVSLADRRSERNVVKASNVPRSRRYVTRRMGTCLAVSCLEQSHPDSGGRDERRAFSSAAALAGTVIVTVAMAWTAYLGGQIAHPETTGAAPTRAGKRGRRAEVTGHGQTYGHH